MSYTRPHEDRLGTGGSVGEFLKHTGSGTAEWTAVSATLSYGSNASTVGEIGLAGGSNAVARADHYHAGIGTIISNGSNTLQRGTFRMAMGNGISWGLSDSDGDGEFDTVTFHAAGGGGGGGGTTLTVQESDGSPSGTVSTLVFPNDSVSIAGSTATIRDVPQGAIGCRVYRNTTQSIAHNTFTAIEFNTENFDTDGFHSTVTNTNRITIPSGLGGKYLIFGGIEYSPSDADGDRIATVRKNGSTFIAWDRRSPTEPSPASGAGEHSITTSTVYDLSAGDYIELMAYQTSGSSINASNRDDGGLHFGVMKLESGKVGTGIGASAYNTATQSISNNSSTNVTFNSEYFDTDGFHSTSADTDRFTIPAGLGGKYIVTAALMWAANSTNSRQAGITINGGNRGMGAKQDNPSANEFGQSITMILDLAAGDIVRLAVYQNSGGSLNIGSSVNVYEYTRMAIMRLDSGSSGSDGTELTISEEDGSPLGTVDTLIFPQGSVTIDGSEGTIRQVPYAFIGVGLSEGTNTLNNGSNTYIVFDNADLWDSDAFHNPSSNNTRMTVPAGLGGKYLLQVRLEIASSTSTDRRCGYRINGGTDVILKRDSDSITAISSYLVGSIVLDLAAGDYVEVFGYINAASINVNTQASLTKLDSGKVGDGIGARAVASTLTSMGNGVWTAIAFDGTDLFDTDGFHNPSSNNTRMTIPAGLGGIYVIGGEASFVTATGGSRGARIRLNGSTTLEQQITDTAMTGGFGIRRQVTTVYRLNAGDYVEIEGFNNQGAAVNSSPSECSLWVARLDSGSQGIPPGYEYAYVEQTSAVGITATVEGSADTIVSAPAVVFDGATTVIVEFSAPALERSTNGSLNVWLFQDGSSIGLLSRWTNPQSANGRVPVLACRRLTPSSGSHTYSIRGTIAGTGTASVFAGAGGSGTDMPAFIRITKV